VNKASRRIFYTVKWVISISKCNRIPLCR